MSDWYDKTNNPANNSPGQSSLIRAEFSLIEAAMAKLPALSGNAGRLVRVNAGETGLDTTEAGSGGSGSGGSGGDMFKATYDVAGIEAQIVGLVATQTLTNKTLTTPTITLKQSSAPTPTAEGDIRWDTDDNLMAIGDGSGTKYFHARGATLGTNAANAALVADGSGNIDFADKQLKRVNLLDFGLVNNAIGSIGGGTQSIDLTLGNAVTATVDTSTTTFTFDNPTATDEECGFVLYLTNGGSQTVNWPGSVDWASGTAPTLTTSGVDVLIFLTNDGGTTWFGAVYGLNFS